MHELKLRYIIRQENYSLKNNMLKSYKQKLYKIRSFIFAATSVFVDVHGHWKHLVDSYFETVS